MLLLRSVLYIFFIPFLGLIKSREKKFFPPCCMSCSGCYQFFFAITGISEQPYHVQAKKFNNK